MWDGERSNCDTSSAGDGPRLGMGELVWLETHCSRLIRYGDGCSGPRRRLLPTAPSGPDTFGVNAGQAGMDIRSVAVCSIRANRQIGAWARVSQVQDRPGK